MASLWGDEPYTKDQSDRNHNYEEPLTETWLRYWRGHRVRRNKDVLMNIVMAAVLAGAAVVVVYWPK